MKTSAPAPTQDSAFTQEIKAKSALTQARTAAQSKMQALSSSEFTRMEIISYEKDQSDNYTEISRFKVGINPKNYARKFSIPRDVKKDKSKANGQISQPTVVEFTESLDFTLDLDCTGAIPNTNEVKDDLAWLSGNLVKFDGEMHSVRYVKITWGMALDFFYGQLKSMSVTYSYFDRNGRPLRASVALSFERIVAVGKAEAKSPDLTHMRIVKDGDTLPMMCNRIYKDPSYYLKVAEANGLPHFMHLEPGQKIYFPPIKT